ncbi:NAD(P)/FAD-dependent oxidoreductase [Devosia beringensis]|uniref:NAD(P)/FAD-dependent oxidoreductase n=1 Tax=Devosia beringensis TaxID=2657486 RepID=UPI00186BADA6|nr:FAD-dependent oxidoreductase [Devosia beringensis]
MKFDAIVIGAGPGGASTALSLARQGRSVAIIERSEFPRRKVCGEFISAVNLALLDRLGVGEAFRNLAGPEVARLALFASGAALEAPMPKADSDAFGRALGRDVLDNLLLDAARHAGITVLQPWRAVEITRNGDLATVRIEERGQAMDLAAPVVVAAHGSWEPGKLTSNLEKRNRPHDFLGFKAHLTQAKLASNLMPLLLFPGGYGGMVWADKGRLSISCCIRRDVLTQLRSNQPGLSAAQVVHRHILASCPSAQTALADARLHEEWLAAGPIRPGIRQQYQDDIFRVGNIAGESHPIIAEGISMALQSGWLLAEQLRQVQIWDKAGRAVAGAAYAKAWRRQFAIRIHAAAFLAKLAIFPQSASLVRTVVKVLPAALSVGARVSGKTKTLPGF